MNSKKSLTEALDDLSKEAHDQAISIRKICDLLSDKGYAIIFTMLSLPVCLPITLPGICEPIGITMAILGWRFGLKKNIWLPQWLLSKEISPSQMASIIIKAKAVLKMLKLMMRSRLTFLVKSPACQLFHGCLICILSLLLALPLPIPFTNTFAAFPIFTLALALLEDDGAAVILSYALAIVCFCAFGLLFFFGFEGLHWLWMTFVESKKD